MKRRSPLRKNGRSEVAKCKDRIQKLLTQIVRVRDGCIFFAFPQTGVCSGPIAADHIISRIRNVSYGDTRNVVGSCQRHHIWWKPQNSRAYNAIVNTVVGVGIAQWLDRVENDKKVYHYSLNDWAKVETDLTNQLKALQND